MSKKRATHAGPHQYERSAMGRNNHEIYVCRIVGCPHYLPDITLAINSLCLCWGGCGRAVQMDQRMVNHDKIVKPYCTYCSAARAERKAMLLAAGRE